MTTKTTKHEAHRNHDKHAVRFVSADEIIFDRINDEFAALAKTRRDTVAKSELSEERIDASLFDGFNALARVKPTRHADADPLAAAVFNAIESASDYHALRHFTVADDAAAALGANSLLGSIIDAVSDETAHAAQDLDDAEADLADAEARLEDAKAAQANEGDDSEDGEPTEADKGVEYFEGEVEQAADAAALAATALKQAVAADAGDMKAAASEAVADAATKCKGLAAIGSMAGTGTTTTGKSSLPLEAKLAIADKLTSKSDKFARFVDMLGNMTDLCESKRKTISNHEAGEIVDLTTGGEIDLLIDEEIALMQNPIFAKLQLAKLADEDLSQFRVEARSEQGKGDIVVLVDESGSMHGDRDLESKAIAGAIVHNAAKQNRNVIVHTFQSNITATFRFLRTESPRTLANNLVALVERGVAGGTSFDPCLNQAIDDIEGRGNVTDADIVIITDGDASLNSKTESRVEALKTAKGINVYATIIGNASAGGLASVADKVWQVDTASESANNLFTELVKK